MVHRVVQERYEGTPQGGPFWPLLSNILSDKLDKELERRGHRFCRYADDCNIYVRSKCAGERMLSSIENFLLKELKLRVNREKSAVVKPEDRGFRDSASPLRSSRGASCPLRLLKGSKGGSNRSLGTPVEYPWNR